MFIPRAIAAAATLASGVLVPLYLDPQSGPDCTPWAPLISTIQAHPTVPFWVVINPNSGPGNRGAQAPAAYQQCVPKLRAANVKVLGYVPTGYGAAKRRGGVLQDTNTYAGWKTAYRPDGIFFDEVSGNAADVSTYANYASQAREVFGRGKGYVAFNPGAAPSSTKYYGLADLLLSAEKMYDDFDPSDLTLGSSTQAQKQAVVLTDGPSTPPDSLIETLITDDHIKAFYVTDDTQANNGNPYDSLPSDLDDFVAAIQSAQS
ncbi:Spherulation-specific family 4 [Trametes polyzona]|nr:Spherulation-specific family 4 [Trametes polyzona]